MWAISGGSSAPPTETERPPNIRWSTKRSSPVAEVEADPQVALVGGSALLHQQLAAHPEVAEEGVAVVEREPEVLAAAQGALEPATGQRGGEAGRAAQVAAYRTGVQDGDRLDGAADDVAGQAVADGLDLGQLGHGSRGSGQSATSRMVATSSPYAVSAAACSASFLERPTPLP